MNTINRSNSPKSPSPRCGGSHWSSDCSFRNKTCFRCKKRGHSSKVCRAEPLLANTTTETNHCVDTMDKAYALFNIRDQKTKPMCVTVSLNDHAVQMQVDMEASISIMSSMAFKNIWEPHAKPKLETSNIQLLTYTSEPVKVIRTLNVNVRYNTQERKLPLVVVFGNGPSFLGRNWLQHIKLNWSAVHYLST